MTTESHYRALEKMYLAAPINKIFLPKIQVAEGEIEIEIDVSQDHFHSAGALHGSVYFKMLDDAAFFAANSYSTDVFVLTTSFTTYLTRPVSSGVIKSVGRVVNMNRTQWITEAVAYNDGKEIARGSGVFVKGKFPLRDALGYEL